MCACRPATRSPTRRRSSPGTSTDGRADRGGRSTIDGIAASGRYALHWRAGGRSGQSEGFTVAERAHGDQLVSDIVHYIKGQRCSGVWDAADRSAPRVGDGAVRDVHGGWYDASGDYSKYLSHLSYANFMNPQQTPLVVWVLARAWHIYSRARGAGPAPGTDPGRGAPRRRLAAAHAGRSRVLVHDAVRRLVEGSRATRAVLVSHAARPQGRRLPGGLAPGRGHGCCGAGDRIDARRRHRTTRRRIPAGRAAWVRAPARSTGLRTSTTAARTSSTTRAPSWRRRNWWRRSTVGRCPTASPASSRIASNGCCRGAVRPTVTCGWSLTTSTGRGSTPVTKAYPGLALLRFAELRPDATQSAAAANLAAELIRAQVALGTSSNNPFRYPPHWVQTRRQAGTGPVVLPARERVGILVAGRERASRLTGARWR